MSGGGNGRSEGAEKLSSITEPTTLFAPVNYDDFMVSNVGDSNSFIDLHLDAPMTIFPSLETRHKRNAAKRRKREKITPIHHLTTSIEVISKTLLAEGKLIPRVRAKSSAVAVVEEEEDDLDDDEDEDDADEDEDEEYDSPQLPYHFSEPSPFHAQQSSQPWPVQQASAPSQITLSEPVPQQIRSGKATHMITCVVVSRITFLHCYLRPTIVPPVPPVPAGKPTVQEIRPVGRPRTAHLKPEGGKYSFQGRTTLPKFSL